MIAITGIGAVSAVGESAAATFAGLMAGRCGLVSVDGGAPMGVVPNGPHLTSDLALRAVREALGACPLEGLGLVGATTSGDMAEGERGYRQWLTGGGASRSLIHPQLADRPAQRVQRALGITGPRASVSTACTSGGVAVGLAADWLRDGVVERVVVFGADALCAITIEGFGALGAVSAERCRPFDDERSGLSLGEGAGALLLETPSAAAARGAEVLAWVVGYGNASDAHHMTAPDPSGAGAERAIRAALGSVDAAEVGLVSAHGTATPLNDVMESRALLATVPQVPVVGIKGAIGHTLGAAGAIELVVAIQALRAGVLPPTVGLGQSSLGLRVSANTMRVVGDYALSVNFAFGGNNLAVLVKR